LADDDPHDDLDQSSAPPLPSEATVQRFLEVQSRDLQVRMVELELRRTEIDHGAKYAEKTLEAQLQDRKDDREQRRRISNGRLFATVIVIFAVLAFASLALYWNKEAIVMEALKIVGSAVVGFTGGFFYGRGKGMQSGRTSDKQGQD
jgi:hypothetical protein